MYAIYPNNFYLLTFYSLVYRIQYVFIPMTYRIRNIFYKDSIVSVFWDWLLALKDQKKNFFFISISFSTVALGAKSIKLFLFSKNFNGNWQLNVIFLNKINSNATRITPKLRFILLQILNKIIFRK